MLKIIRVGSGTLKSLSRSRIRIKSSRIHNADILKLESEPNSVSGLENPKPLPIPNRSALLLTDSFPIFFFYRKRSRSVSRKSRSPARRSRSRSPPRRRARAAPRYNVSIPKISLHFPQSNVMELKKRYSSLYIPSDFFTARHLFTEAYPIHAPFRIQFSSAFQVSCSAPLFSRICIHLFVSMRIQDPGPNKIVPKNKLLSVHTDTNSTVVYRYVILSNTLKIIYLNSFGIVPVPGRSYCRWS